MVFPDQTYWDAFRFRLEVCNTNSENISFWLAVASSIRHWWSYLWRQTDGLWNIAPYKMKKFDLVRGNSLCTGGGDLYFTWGGARTCMHWGKKKMRLFTGKQNLDESPHAGSFASTKCHSSHSWTFLCRPISFSLVWSYAESPYVLASKQQMV